MSPCSLSFPLTLNTTTSSPPFSGHKATQLLNFSTMDERSQAKCLFDKLPSELMDQIYGLCSVNAKLCLKMCCKTWHDRTPETVRQLYEDLSRTIDFGNARFDRLCLDDIYTGSKTKRHVCSVCWCLHRAEEFTEQQLQEGPRTRVCEASQRVLDLTPGNSFTYQQVLHSRNTLLPLTFPYDYHFKCRPVEDQGGQWMVVMDWVYETECVVPRTWIWEDDLRQMLESVPTFACPHLLSCDPQVLQAITSYRDNRFANPAFTICSTCNTKVEFSIPVRSETGKSFFDWSTSGVSFHVERRIGRLGESAVDPRWKAQSLPPLRM